MVAFSFGGIGKFFGSAGFKSVATAVGTSLAGELGARLGNIAADRGYQPSAQPTTVGQAKQAGYLPGGYGYQTTPWGLIVAGVALVAVLAFVLGGRRG